jgi:predicted patatin/cPLA2 family phospholipase
MMKAKLFVQGGGMRGLYSLAALARLEELKLTDHFDVVEGASAGAINGSYFVAGQAREAIGVYIELARSKEFIRFSRVNRILDVDYLVDSVLKQKYPIALDRYWGSAIEMRTIVTDAGTGAEFVITNRSREVDVYELLRATAALPILYHKKVRIAETDYVDGGVSRKLPGRPDLASDRPLLAVLTRPLTYRESAPNGLGRVVTALRTRSMSPEVCRGLRENFTEFNRTMAHLQTLPQASPIRVIAPLDVKSIAGRTTRNADLLEATIRTARDDVERCLEGWVGLEA